MKIAGLIQITVDVYHTLNFTSSMIFLNLFFIWNPKKILLFTVLPLQGILFSIIRFEIINIPILDRGDFLFHVWLFFNFIPLGIDGLLYMPFYFERGLHQYDWFTIPIILVISNLIFWLIIAYVFRDIGSKHHNSQ